MLIDKKTPSEFGAFSIRATPDRQLVAVFVDLSTRLFIVEETLTADERKTSRPLYVTTLDPKSGEIIPIMQRDPFIDYSAGEEIDEELQVRRTYRRTVNPITGGESIEEELYTRDGKKLGTSSSMAFSKDKVDNAFAGYRKRLEQQKQEDLFWKVEYPKKSFDEKVHYWTVLLRRQMRWQCEAGLDEHSIYTPDWYRRTLELDSDFERVFDGVLKNFSGYGWDVKAIRQKVGAIESPSRLCKRWVDTM